MNIKKLVIMFFIILTINISGVVAPQGHPLSEIIWGNNYDFSAKTMVVSNLIGKDASSNKEIYVQSPTRMGIGINNGLKNDLQIGSTLYTGNRFAIGRDQINFAIDTFSRDSIEITQFISNKPMVFSIDGDANDIIQLHTDEIKLLKPVNIENSIIKMTNLEDRNYGNTYYYLCIDDTDSKVYKSVYPCDAVCFKGNTKVLLLDQSQKQIMDLVVGDRIIGWDEKTGKNVEAVIQKVFAHGTENGENRVLDKILFSNGKYLEATSNHPFYVVGKGWTTVAELKAGDKVKSFNDGVINEETIVSIIRDYSETGVVYNLMTTTHDYYANDILVHNKCLIEGTLIMMTNDIQKNIEDVKPGEHVSGFVDGKIVPVRVTHIYQKTWHGKLPKYAIEFTDGSVVESTPNHLYYTPEGIVSAEKLKIGNKITAVNGVKVVKNIVIGEVKGENVWDLNTESNNYFANGVLVYSS